MGWQDSATPDSDAPTPDAGPGAPRYSPDINFVQHVESKGNPDAVSPRGASGTMQTMPTTLTAPGYGVTPARDNSPAEKTRVGREYLTRMQAKYGQVDGLIAYNWGPGNYEKWDKSGRDPAKLPLESHQYVDLVAKARGSNAWSSQATPDEQAPSPTPTATPTPEAPDTNYSNEGRMHPPAKVDPFALTPVGHVDTAGQLKSIGSRILQGAAGTMDTMKAKIEQATPQFAKDTSAFPPEEQARIAQERAATLTRAVDFEKNKKGKLGMSGKFGEMLPGLAGTAALAPLAAAAGPAIAPLLGPLAPLAGTLGDAAVYGAAGGAQSALEGNKPADVALDTLGAGIGAGAGHAVGGLVQRGLEPIMHTAGKTMLQEGIAPTIGQSFGRTGSAIEGGLEYAPIVGPGVSFGRTQTGKQLSRSVVNDALKPIGQTIDKKLVGDEAVAAGKAAASAHYDSMLDQVTMQAPGMVATLKELPQAIASKPKPGGAAAAQQVTDYANDLISGHINWTKPMDGTAWKEIDRDLGAHIAAFRNEGTVHATQVADGLKELQDLWRKNLTENVVGSGAKQGIRNADAAWQKLVPAQSAANRAAGVMGEFSPEQIHAAALRAKAPQSAIDVAARQVIPGVEKDEASKLPVKKLLKWAAQIGGTAKTALSLAHPAISIPLGAATYGLYSNAGRRLTSQGLQGFMPSMAKMPFTLAQLGGLAGGGAALNYSPGEQDAP